MLPTVWRQLTTLGTNSLCPVDACKMLRPQPLTHHRDRFELPPIGPKRPSSRRPSRDDKAEITYKFLRAVTPAQSFD